MEAHTYIYILELYKKLRKRPRKLHSSWLNGSLFLYYCKAKSKIFLIRISYIVSQFPSRNKLNPYSITLFCDITVLWQMVILICLVLIFPVIALLTEVRRMDKVIQTITELRKPASLQPYGLHTNAYRDIISQTYTTTWAAKPEAWYFKGKK